MKIDGRAVAREMLEELKIEVSKLKKRGIVPTLAVILVGDNPASLSYIKQKKKMGEEMGANVIISHQQAASGNQQLKKLIQECNASPKVHGIIIQRPVPTAAGIDPATLLTVLPKKDVDGLVPGTKFEVPVVLAAMEILRFVFSQVDKGAEFDQFDSWLKGQSIVVVGRGETAGKPVASYFKKLKCTTSVIHSQTPNPKKILKQADIIISCSGKPGIVTRKTIKPGVILVGVGIRRDVDGLKGDYNEEEIQDVASYYTPTPGGVGPVNVAGLMQNLVRAAILTL